jgi:hypothetical protein
VQAVWRGRIISVEDDPPRWSRHLLVMNTYAHFVAILWLLLELIGSQLH